MKQTKKQLKAVARKGDYVKKMKTEGRKPKKERKGLFAGDGTLPKSRKYTLPLKDRKIKK